MADKICLLGDAASSHTEKWVTGLARRGWDIEVISFRPAQIHEAKVHVIPRLTGTKLDAFLKARWVREKVRSIKPDLVHAHYATSYGVLGVLSKAHPLIISAWGSDIFQFPRQSMLHQKLLRWILARADLLCSTSQVMAEEMKLYLSVDRPVEITPFGVNTERFTPAEKDRNDGMVRFGVAKNLHSIYGIDLLIKAFAGLAKEASSACELCIAGDGPEREPLQALAQTLGVSEQVVWAGALTNEKVADFYRSVDVVVVPSRQESFGVTAVEGLACGKPVIATKVGGLPEIVTHRENGFLVETENVEDLAQAMRTLRDDAVLRRAMGEAGRESVLKHYDWEQNISIMEKIYCGVVYAAHSSSGR